MTSSSAVAAKRYRRVRKLGEGAHGIVYQAIVVPASTAIDDDDDDGELGKRKAVDDDDVDDDGGGYDDDDDDSDAMMDDASMLSFAPPHEYRAIKKIRLKSSREGLSMEAIREIKLLLELDHPNVMKVHEVFHASHNIHIVLDFMETDLEKLILSESIRALQVSDIKAYMSMLLAAVQHCHDNWILHRDLKPSNLLIGQSGVLKLSDFGLAKVYGSPNRLLSHQVCTLWYRAPELLFGARSYGAGADMWSVGCIFAQLMLRRPLLHGDNELSQLSSIFAHLGTPTESAWPAMVNLPNYIPFQHVPAPPLRSLFHAASSDAIDLLSRMFVYDPSKRISAADALTHPYFQNAPPPTPLHLLPRVPRAADNTGTRPLN